MRSVAGVLTLVSLTVTACGREPASASVDIKAEEQAIRRISAQWLELTRQQDAARIAALFADDGRLLLGGQEVLIGVDRIREFMTKDFAANPKRTIEWQTDRVEVATAGDFAVEFGTYVIQNAGPEGTQANRGSYATVYRKTDGGWKVAADAPVSSVP